MKLNQRINLLCELGSFLQSYCDGVKKDEITFKLDSVILESVSINPFFQKENILYNLNYWAKTLKQGKLNSFVSKYDLNKKQINVGIIMAGNIPLVGFHDFMCVFLSGNKSIIKLSSKDNKLFKFMFGFLKGLSPSFEKYIKILNDRFRNFDAVIATGNDLSANQFKKYFKNIPNIIRNSRYSVTILDGNESNEDLKKLSFDIFMYYGLGCRNVSKIFIPTDYDINHLINHFTEWKNILNNSTYYNNYIYYKTIFLMNRDKFLDTGFCILKKSTKIGSPISCIFYEHYSSLEQLKKNLKQNADKIQCIVSNNIVENSIEFGSTQSPSIDDYADKINTMEFLLKLS